MEIQNPVIQHDIVSFEGVPLAKQGDVLTPEFIKSLSEKRKIRPTKLPFFSTASFQSDIDAFLSESQYDRLFHNSESKARIRQAVIQQSVYSVVVDALIYIRTLNYDAYRHLLVCSALATRIALDLEVRSRKKYALTALAPGHDIGKLALPIEVLTKETPLNDEEKEWVKHHSLAGYLTLLYYVGQEDPTFCRVAYEHHERLDGSGYPRGIRQNDETVQIMAVCDMFNALISPRPYRKDPYTVPKAIEILQQEASLGKLSLTVVSLLKSYCHYM